MITPVEFRRHLHRNPELSFKEFESAEYIMSALKSAGIECERVAQTGVLARISKGERRERAIVLRADIDALPIREESGVEWSSNREGVMHACGHDIHAAVLYGALCRLLNEEFEGSVLGLFQPAEESNPGGAQLVLDENPFAGYDVVAVIGEHVEPELEVGELGFKAGKYMAGNDEIYFELSGRGGHAAMRHITQDTVSAASELILKLTSLNKRDLILSIGRVEALGATNVIPDKVSMQGTLRTFDEGMRRDVKCEIAKICEEQSARCSMNIEFKVKEGYPSVVNDVELTNRAIALAKSVGLKVKNLDLRATSEDFGRYCEKYPSLFYRLGVGGSSGRVHTSTFNPDEEAIDVGIDFMLRLGCDLLK